MGRAGWILVGGCCLAFLAAALNVAFMVSLGTSVSHLTGDLSRFAIDLTSADPDSHTAVAFLGAALGGFVLGASVSGLLIHHPRLELSRPYGRSIAAIGVVLVVAHAVLPQAQTAAVALAALACGYQNALATHYRGVVLRTTHVTGLLTDLGVQLGMRLRGHEVEGFRMLAPASLVLAFFAGAAAGALLAQQLAERALLVVGLTYVVAGLGWSFLKHAVLRLGAGG